MIGFLWTVRFLEQALQPDGASSVPATITAAGGAVAAVLSGFGVFLLKRSEAASRESAAAAQAAGAAAQKASERIGEPNGQHDVVTMLITTQQMMATHAREFATFREEVGNRFDGMHQALIDERDRTTVVEGRLEQLERPEDRS